MQEQDAPGLDDQEKTPESDGDESSDPQEPGGGLSADDLAQPTTTGDPTGDRATGLTSLGGG